MSFLGQVADTWQALIDLIIRPPRHEYSVQRELGPQRLVVRGGLVIREDIEVHAAAAARPALRCGGARPALQARALVCVRCFRSLDPWRSADAMLLCVCVRTTANTADLLPRD
jgi:hypothetical protein